MEIIIAIVCLIIGALVSWIFASQKLNDANTQKSVAQQSFETANTQVIETNNLLNQARQKNTEQAQLIAQLETLLTTGKEKLDNQKLEIEELQKKFTIQFENIASKILKENTSDFSESHKNKLNEILKPLNEKIQSFEKSINDKYVDETKEKASLKEQINQLVNLNQSLSLDAKNLTNALKGDSKIQGDWGEVQLEMILEKAGLVKGIHFDTQSTYRDEDSNLKKPDFIIHLPDDKNLIVDSKVSLTAYEQFFNADEADQEIYLKKHVESIKNHIKDLSSKNYQTLYGINSPDYVLMFIPIEPAYSLAIQGDDKLFLDALDKNIVVVTTSTLLATMRTVSFIWKQDNQKKNVLEIATQSGALYDKFTAFVADLIDVGVRMDSAKKSYSQAMNKLTDGTGNLVKRAEKIKELGAKASKQLPQKLVDRATNNNTIDE